MCAGLEASKEGVHMHVEARDQSWEGFLRSCSPCVSETLSLTGLVLHKLASQGIPGFLSP